MPIKHIVLMKFKGETDTETLQEAGRSLVALKGMTRFLHISTNLIQFW